MAYQFGLTGSLLYTYPADGNQALTEADNVRDVTLTLTTIDADTTSRASTLFKSSKVLLLEGVVTFEILDEIDDPFLVALQTAFTEKAEIALWIKDSSVASEGQGLDGDFNITSFTRNEPLEDVMTYSVEAKPNNELREPAWNVTAP